MNNIEFGWCRGCGKKAERCECYPTQASSGHEPVVSVSENPIATGMRQIYCCRGATFARPNLEAGWKEIYRLEAEVKRWKNVAEAAATAQTKTEACQIVEDALAH